MTWWDALVAAGAVRAAFVPPASVGRTDADDGAVPAADLVEGDALPVHAVPAAISPPTCFLDGIERWKVVGYDGVLPVIRAYVAAAVRRRGGDRRLRTAAEAARDFAVAPLGALAPTHRRVLAERCLASLGPGEWLVVDGLLSVSGKVARHPRALGVIKSHGAQFWLLAERAPLATPDARWDRLLYPIHDVETYLQSRAPRELLAAAGSRLPRTGT